VRNILYRVPLGAMLRSFIVEPAYPKRKEQPRSFLDAIVGESQRLAQSKRVAEVVAAGDIDQDLRQAIEVRLTCSDPLGACDLWWFTG
jgi:hypothetical protein